MSKTDDKSPVSHSVSPWEIDGSPSGLFHIKSGDKIVCMIPADWLTLLQDGMDKEEVKANARLIKIAPRLLELSKKNLVVLEKAIVICKANNLEEQEWEYADLARELYDVIKESE